MGAPNIPREGWTAHENYPQQVLLLGSHDNFRFISRHLIEQAFVGASHIELRALYRRWISGMRSHEAYEERKLYPYLERRWSTSLADAQEGHDALHAAHDQVLAAFAAMDETVAARPALIAALQRHDQVLLAHLALEEDRVIPMLLGLSREEFVTYANTPAHILLREQE